MKQLIQTLQYFAAATAVFIIFYLSYILIAGMYAFVFPLFFLLAIGTIIFARHNKGDQ